jgi:hypothetical protein
MKKENPQIPLSKAFSGICIITVKFCPLVPKYQENDELYFFLAPWTGKDIQGRVVLTLFWVRSGWPHVL